MNLLLVLQPVKMPRILVAGSNCWTKMEALFRNNIMVQQKIMPIILKLQQQHCFLLLSLRQFA